MNKQEVLEKIILYITKRRPEDFYSVIKDKYYINISAIENNMRKNSFSGNDYETSIQNLCEEYKLKRISFKDFKSELEQILQNVSVERDRKVSNIKIIQDRKKFVHEELNKLTQTIENAFHICDLKIDSFPFEWFLSDYEKFILKQEKCAIHIDDFICHPNHIKYILEQHYEESKNQLVSKFEKKEQYYKELKQLFLSISKEDLFIPLEEWWAIKLKLDILYYVPPARTEQKILSFFYIFDHHRVNYSMRIDAYLHQTLQTLSTSYCEFAVDEFREYYKNIFGDLVFRPNFLQKVKTLLSWSMYRILFMNICLTSNIFLFGEQLRTWTKNTVIYPHKNYKLEKKYPLFIDSDITSQKIVSGLETPKQINDVISSILNFDNKDILDDSFLEKNNITIKTIFESE